jgi:hypothetical protein
MTQGTPGSIFLTIAITLLALAAFSCMDADPERVASRTLAHGLFGRGAPNLRGPVGGWAYGTPRNTRTPSSMPPARTPSSVSTRSWWFLLIAGSSGSGPVLRGRFDFNDRPIMGSPWAGDIHSAL